MLSRNSTNEIRTYHTSLPNSPTPPPVLTICNTAYNNNNNNTCRQKYCAKGSGKKVKIHEFVCRDATNVEPEMYDCTGNNWSHWNSNEKLKEKNLETVPGKHSIDSLQKTAILGTSHTIRKVLQCEA